MAAHGFHKGGTIGDIINKSGEDGFVLAQTGEEILSLEKIQALGEAFAQMNPVIDALQTIPELSSATSNSTSPINVGAINVELDLSGVESYEDFVYKVQHDKNFENMIQDMTIGRIFGGSQLSKYKH